MRHHSTTIFTEISAIAARCDAVNLGQGFPDTDGPQPMLAAARRAIADGANQYPPLGGRPELVSAIAEHQRQWAEAERALKNQDGILQLQEHMDQEEGQVDSHLQKVQLEELE